MEKMTHQDSNISIGSSHPNEKDQLAFKNKFIEAKLKIPGAFSSKGLCEIASIEKDPIKTGEFLVSAFTIENRGLFRYKIEQRGEEPTVESNKINGSPFCYDIKSYGDLFIGIESAIKPTLVVFSKEMKLLKSFSFSFGYSSYSRMLHYYDEMVFFITSNGIYTIDLREGERYLKLEHIVLAVELYHISIDKKEPKIYSCMIPGGVYKSDIRRIPKEENLPEKEDKLADISRENFSFYCIHADFDHVFLAAYNDDAKQNLLLALNRDLEPVSEVIIKEMYSWPNHLKSFVAGSHKKEYLVTSVVNFINVFQFDDRKTLNVVFKKLDIFESEKMIIHGIFVDESERRIIIHGGSENLYFIDLKCF